MSPTLQNRLFNRRFHTLARSLGILIVVVFAWLADAMGADVERAKRVTILSSESRVAPVSIWEDYQSHLTAVLVIIASNVALMTALLLQRRRRRRVEAAYSDIRQFVELATEGGGVGLWVRDLDKDEFWVNPRARLLLGLGPRDAVGMDSVLARIHPADRAQVMSVVERAQEAGGPFEVEYRTVARSDSPERWILVRGQFVYGPQRQSLRRMGTMIDITELKLAEEKLRESEERFRAMADAAPVMIWMSGADKLCTFFNRGWLDFTGRTLEQELGNGWVEGVHRDDVNRCLDIYAGRFDERREFTMEYRLRRSDGEHCWVLDRGVPRFEADGTFLGYIGTAIDISAHRRAEEALEKERAFLRQVIDVDPNFIFAKDREGRFTLVNQALADAYGTTVENLIGKTDADFNPNREEVEFFRRMDLEVMDTLQEQFIPEEQITDAQGKVRWLQTVKRPILDRDGSANQILGAATDITRRKAAETELQQNRSDLAHVTRLSTMGELAASLAHELNQPLTGILSNAQAAQRFLAANPADLDEVNDILKDIVQDDNRASAVIQRVRALVKKEKLEFSTLNLAGVVGDVVQLIYSDAILHGVRIVQELGSGLPAVQGDRVQLQQVILNLLLNSFDAIEACPPREREVLVRVELDGAEKLRVSVRDRGIGLKGDKIDKIFQPFYTTKLGGLGMGLSISRSIIEAHGGQLCAENNPCGGATFYFILPVDGKPPGATCDR